MKIDWVGSGNVHNVLHGIRSCNYEEINKKSVKKV
jgi:hypothetical protein